ncbi:GxxExxY protein [Owenweeksia hongkongensis]|uniref:GxxExxY protein n=1 Tax=Owenweeksia hongkongensis TaxID=253245 RepID=UPI003A947D0F
MTDLHLNQISKDVIAAAIEVHKTLGPGLLESVYQNCLFLELKERGIKFKAQAIVPLTYKGTAIQKDYIIDFLVEDQIVLELKAIETVLPIHEAQLLTYLKLADKPLGLLINFNVSKLTDGITRRVNNFKE